MTYWYTQEASSKAKRDLIMVTEYGKGKMDEQGKDLLLTYCPPFASIKKDEINSLAEKLEKLKDV